MKRKINLRLILIALIAIVATMVGITVVYYNLFKFQVRESLSSQAMLLSRAISSHTSVAPFFNTLRTESLRVTLIDSKGNVLGDNYADIRKMDNHLSRPEVQEAFKTGQGESIRDSYTLGTDTFNYALRLEDERVLRVSTEVKTITSVFLDALPIILLIMVVIFLACLIIAHLLTRQLIRPIESMAEHLDNGVAIPPYRELIPFFDKIRLQHDKILAAAKSRQEFTANVSHELKTPLTAISGYSELIENQMVDSDQDVYMAKQIRHNAKRLLILINDIIELSNLDHMERPKQLRTFDLYQLALECCENLQMNAMQKEVKLFCDGAATTLSADQDLIQELLTNLIQNAITYNKKEGGVYVKVGVKENRPFLQVRDNGIGIPKDQQERIFERFYRVDKSRSRETGGTGLGLAIVKHIAELHEAHIVLDSEVGKGTMITVKF